MAKISLNMSKYAIISRKMLILNQKKIYSLDVYLE